ncbi:MAG: serpin family protein [Candidatus Omnitrophica bacterium]|nr:serpin family protein [Candidatus Omnitrophota bacterium]
MGIVNIILFLLVFLNSTCIIKLQASNEYPSVVEANNQFSLNFLYEVEKGTTGNIFFSPFSIINAFGMVYEGANSKTAEEIKRVFHLSPVEEDRLKGFLILNDLLTFEKSNCKLNISNAYWVQENYRLLKNYTEKIEKYYKGEAYNVNFIKEPEKAAARINQWADKKTQGKIKKFLEEGDVNRDTRIVLTNAVYFKGIWQFQFDKKATRLDDFWLDDRRSTKVQMMQLLDKEFPYAETQDFQIIKLPYECQNLAILILLPKHTKQTKRITETDLNEYQKLLKKQKIDVFLPRFKVESTIDLSGVLKNLGINTAFNPEFADFSRMTGNKDLFISKAIQKSYIEVNEEGTEAAAVTGIVMKITAARPEIKKVFRADHPFLFFIIEETSGLILFAGKIHQP